MTESATPETSLEQALLSNQNAALVNLLMLSFAEGRTKPVDATSLLPLNTCVKWPVPAILCTDATVIASTSIFNQHVMCTRFVINHHPYAKSTVNAPILVLPNGQGRLAIIICQEVLGLFRTHYLMLRKFPFVPTFFDYQ